MQLQRDNLGIKLVCRDVDTGDRNWQSEAPGTGTARIEPEHAAAHLDRRLVRVPEYYCRVAGADGSRVSSARDMTPISIRASPGNSRGMQERAQGPGWTYSRSPCIEQTGNYAQLER